MRRRAVLALALAPLAGCGFQLRRWDLGTAFETVHVASGRGVDLHRELGPALAQAGLRALPSAGGADLVIQLSRQRQSQRSGAIVGGRAAEVELGMEIAFSVAGADGKVLVPERLLSAERRASMDRDNLVGSSAEQELLRREMRDDLVARMLRALGSLAEAEADADQR